MFTRIFSSALRIEVGGKSLTFTSLDDLDFTLASRTEVPAAKLEELAQLGDEELGREADGMQRVANHFVDLLARAVELQATVGRRLRGMDLKLFSQDHQWRGIMTALYGQDSDYDAYKRLALERYVQYLNSRQAAVQAIRRRRQRSAVAPVREAPLRGPEDGLRETVLFDAAREEPEGQRPNRLVRAPRGEPVELALAEGEVAELRLSKHLCRLVAGPAARFIDEAGGEHPLREGRNAVGRDPQNDVVLSPDARDVSRVHLVLELDRAGAIRLTDLSSHGTFLSARVLRGSPVTGP
jgi:hypothetical protein